MTSLTRAIEVVFSIRQGDPLAMILYIIYIEPLLLALERDMVGLKVHNMEQKLEAYCDDINLTTNDLSDLGKISEVVEKFEVVSAAILSETYWPLAWLKPVKSLKIFGIFLADSCSEIQKLNWDFRFKKFSDVIFSWSPRILDTLQQRVEVIRMFALSRVYYVAAILPIKPSLVKKFESLMGNFLWKFS